MFSFAKRRWLLTAVALASLVMVATGVQAALAQDQPPIRKFVLDGVHANDPLRILGFRVNNRLVQPGSAFRADDAAWLEGSKIIVKNVSKKTVMGIWINLFFPGIANKNGMAGDQVHIGNRAASEMYTIDGTRLHDNTYPPFLLSPGQTAEIPLGPHYRGVKALRERVAPGVIPARCMVRFAVAYFRNGMKWAPDYFAKPDPNKPGKFISISPADFYGYKAKAAGSPS